MLFLRLETFSFIIYSHRHGISIMFASEIKINQKIVNVNREHDWWTEYFLNSKHRMVLSEWFLFSKTIVKFWFESKKIHWLLNSPISFFEFCYWACEWFLLQSVDSLLFFYIFLQYTLCLTPGTLWCAVIIYYFVNILCFGVRYNPTYS